MSNIVDKRSEIVFLYDIRDGNPNGDPMDENKPRIDEETGINIVTDVRLKRTIRDFLFESRGKEILIRTISLSGGLAIQDAKTRALDFLDKDKKKANFETQRNNISENVLKECIDVRLFGVILPIEINKEKTSFKKTGPVQFNMGRSLHQVEMKHIKGTGAFASTAAKGKEKAQQTFRDEFILHYSLISFHGLINENAAKYTNLTTDDIQLLLDGIWNGTKGLISRSKMGQMSRLLLKVEYNEKSFHIGDLAKGIKLQTNLEEVAIRGPDDYKLDITSLITILANHKDKISNISYKVDNQLKFVLNDKDVSLQKALKDAIAKEPNELNFS